MKHPKVIHMLFNFLFGFSKEEQTNSGNYSSSVFELQNPMAQTEDQVPFVLENQNIDPFEYQNGESNPLVTYFIDELENALQKFDSSGNEEIFLNNIESNSSVSRGPLVPLLNFPNNSGSIEEIQKPKQVQNMIVDSSSNSEEEDELSQEYLDLGKL